MSDSAATLAEIRSGARTNMFIAAAMYVQGTFSTVRVRNLSPSGALIETSVSPAAGSPVQLNRGCLMVSGKVMWSTNNRCGLHFNSFISVRDWMAPPTNQAQMQVDEMVACVKAERLSVLAPPAPDAMHPQLSLSIRLGQLSLLIEELGDSLAGDPETVARHGLELQKIDRALQILKSLRLEAH